MDTGVEMDLQKAKEIVEVLKPIYYDVRLWRYTALQQKEKQMRLGVLCEYHTCMMDDRVTQKDCLCLKAIQEKKHYVNSSIIMIRFFRLLPDI